MVGRVLGMRKPLVPHSPQYLPQRARSSEEVAFDILLHMGEIPRFCEIFLFVWIAAECLDSGAVHTIGLVRKGALGIKKWVSIIRDEFGFPELQVMICVDVQTQRSRGCFRVGYKPRESDIPSLLSCIHLSCVKADLMT